MIREIKKNKNTAQHVENLRKLGYEVAENDEVIRVQCSGVHEEPVDMTDAEKAAATISEIVAQKKVFSYATRFLFEGYENPLFGGVACGQLGKLSCLVTKKEKKAKKASNPAVTDIVNSLGL